jgi:hypothetical protein
MKDLMSDYRNPAKFLRVMPNTKSNLCRKRATQIAIFLLRAGARAALLRSSDRNAALENNMNSTARPNKPQTTRALLDEADIGSGEKTPAQKETEELIRQIPPLPAPDTSAGDAKPRPPQ